MRACEFPSCGPSYFRYAELHITFVFQICDNPKPCEIDPLKLKEGDNVDIHKVRLNWLC